MRTLLSDAIAELELPRNPAARVKAVSEIRPDEDPNSLGPEDLRKLLGAVGEVAPQHYALFLALAVTGMRIGEATALKWSDVNEEHSVIHVRRTQWRGLIKSTKTNRVRTLPLPEELRAVLRRHRPEAPCAAGAWSIGRMGISLLHENATPRPKSQGPLLKALKQAGIELRFTDSAARLTTYYAG